jgi:hypothetical protein
MSGGLARHGVPSLGILAVLLAAALAGGCGVGRTPSGQPGVTTIDAGTLETLRNAFNQDADDARVILLLSPT